MIIVLLLFGMVGIINAILGIILILVNAYVRELTGGEVDIFADGKESL